MEEKVLAKKASNASLPIHWPTINTINRHGTKRSGGYTPCENETTQLRKDRNGGTLGEVFGEDDLLRGEEGKGGV